MNGIQAKNSSSFGNLSNSFDIQEENYGIPFLFISLAIAGFIVLVVNGGVFIILVKDKDIRKNPYLFLVLMLCVSDFVLGLGILCIGPNFYFPSKILIILQAVLMMDGLCLSLLQTFLISLQRYLVLCHENWNLYIFQQNRKYYVCTCSSFCVVIFNFVLISPPNRNFDPVNDRLMLYVYHDHYLAHTIYVRAISLTLLSFTLMFYFVTICYVMKTNQKVKPMGNSNSIELSTVPGIHTTALSPSTYTTTINDRRNDKQQCSRNLLALKRQKVVSTLKLVGVLITLLVIFSGPLVVSLLIEKMSSKFLGVVFSLSVLNSIANPFIYLWKIYGIRQCKRCTICL